MNRYGSEKEWEEILGAELGKNKAIDARIDETYAKLRKAERKRKKQKGRRWKRLFIGTGSIAAAFLLMVMFCAMNPVLAREIPIFGNIFGKLADVFSFGELPEEDTTVFPAERGEEGAQASEEREAGEENIYAKKDAGVTITLTEEYASNQAVYIGICVENEEGFPDLAVYEDNTAYLQIMTKETYSFRQDVLEGNLRTIEGQFQDDHTFIGIMRIDYSDINVDESRYRKYCEEAEAAGAPVLTDENLQEYLDYYEVPDSFDMGLEITQVIGYLAEPKTPEGMKSGEEQEQMTDEEWKAYMQTLPQEWYEFPNDYENWYREGSWDYKIRILQKDEASRKIEVNEINDEGIGVESIELSSVEMTMNIVGGADIFAVALDADGKWMEGSDDNAYVLPVKGHDISKVYIYICDYIEYMDELKGYAFSKQEDGKSFQEVLEERAKFKAVAALDS